MVGGKVGVGMTTVPGATLDVAGNVNVGWASSQGIIGSGSRICFTSGGSDCNETTFEESWGINLTGTPTQPVKIYNASLGVGYPSGGENWGTGNLYVKGNVGIGTMSVDSNYKLTLSGGGVKADVGSTANPAGYFSNAGSGAAVQVGSGAIVAGSGGITLGGVNKTAWPSSGGPWTSGQVITLSNTGNALTVNGYGGNTYTGVVLGISGGAPGYGQVSVINNGTTKILLDGGAGNITAAGTVNASAYQLNGKPFTGSGGSQWTTNAAGIYYNSGNVGIGTTTPGTALQVGAMDVSVASQAQLFLANVPTNGGPLLAGDWASHGLWGIGPATGNNDGLLEDREDGRVYKWFRDTEMVSRFKAV